MWPLFCRVFLHFAEVIYQGTASCRTQHAVSLCNKRTATCRGIEDVHFLQGHTASGDTDKANGWRYYQVEVAYWLEKPSGTLDKVGERRIMQPTE